MLKTSLNTNYPPISMKTRRINNVIWIHITTYTSLQKNRRLMNSVEKLSFELN
ncbi:hypothetical protein DPMN_100010 [Dreissena polymorpha]|uniref:Uncharacterized protein n=1 Tax=Dreissena polymorpha TaxID=45954 RepID=A0A9D4LGQ2_DREPO|nr:hypothetical protein DPMN_100010 [Dreissena polymorpha]